MGQMCPQCHPDMIPYAKLSESTKEYDRVTARAVMAAIGDEIATLRAQLAEVMAERDRLSTVLRQVVSRAKRAIRAHDEPATVLRWIEGVVLSLPSAALAQQPATERAEAERAVIEAARDYIGALHAFVARIGGRYERVENAEAGFDRLEKACDRLAALDAKEADRG